MGRKEENILLLQVISPNLLQHGSGTLTWLQTILNKKHHSAGVTFYFLESCLISLDCSYEQRTVDMILPFSISIILFSSNCSIKNSPVFSLMQIFIAYFTPLFISATRAGYPGAGAMAHPAFPLQKTTVPWKQLLQEPHSEALWQLTEQYWKEMLSVYYRK